MKTLVPPRWLGNWIIEWLTVHGPSLQNLCFPRCIILCTRACLKNSSSFRNKGGSAESGRFFGCNGWSVLSSCIEERSPNVYFDVASHQSALKKYSCLNYGFANYVSGWIYQRLFCPFIVFDCVVWHWDAFIPCYAQYYIYIYLSTCSADLSVNLIL